MLRCPYRGELKSPELTETQCVLEKGHQGDHFLPWPERLVNSVLDQERRLEEIAERLRQGVDESLRKEEPCSTE
jgi:hypothetical protein